MEKVINISKKLNQTSEKQFNNPYTSIEWDENINETQLSFTPEYISLFGTPLYETLTPEQINKLSFWEAINFFSININGEKDLIAGLSMRLYKKYPKEVTDYIHHFLDEENKHMLWFGNFCMKYGNKVYQDKKLVFPREYAIGEEEFLFFAKVVIFEELVDNYNTHMSKDERLHPLVRQIHKQHHIDESRHLAFGREITKFLYDKHSSEDWDDEVRNRISEYLANYMVSTWREYYNPEVYADSGLENSYDVMEAAWDNETTRAFRKRISEKCIKYFMENNMMKKEPEL